MGHVPIGLRLDKELLARIDAALGDVPRSRWIARACEAYLSLNGHGKPGGVVVVDENIVISHRVPSGPPARSYRSSLFAKRDVRPVPKRGA